MALAASRSGNPYARTTSHTHTWMLYAPGLPAKLDYPDMLSLHAPKPALVPTSTEDKLFTLAETKRAYRKLNAAWKKAGTAGALDTRLYPGGHQFSVRMQDEAFDWLGLSL